MEEIEGVNCFSEGRSSSETRPPNPNSSIASAFRQCQRNDPLVLPCRKSLVRHASLVRNESLFFSVLCFHCDNDVTFLVLEQLLQHLLLFLK